MKARPFKGAKIGKALTIALLLALTAGNVATQSPTELPAKDLSAIDLSKSEGAKYFLIVKAYADYMITHGRDRYGKEHSPLFATTLNRETGNVYRENPPDAPKGIRNGDRTWRGSNTSKDNGLYSILYHLTEITGDDKYAQEADKAIKWFFANCQSPETGFMAWGEHIGWDFFTEAPIKMGTRSLIHEYKIFNYWDKVWEFNPEAAEKFALGLWEHQIYAHEGPEAGEFSRHASYDTHSPGKGRAFPAHGGNYIYVWTKAYRETGKEVFLTAIETVLNYYERNTTDKGAILYASDFPEQYSLKQSMNLASNLYRAKDFMPADLANRMKKLSEGTDSLYLSFDHDPSKDGKGFLESANLMTLVPGNFRRSSTGTDAWTEMWSAGYGVGSGSAGQANKCYARYKLTGIEGYRILFMKSVNAYYNEDPPPSAVLYPSNYSSIFNTMMNAYELTGAERFLSKAKTYMDLSVETFLSDQSPLPKASNQSEHYEAITGGPELMENMLRLWMVMNPQDRTGE